MTARGPLLLSSLASSSLCGWWCSAMHVFSEISVPCWSCPSLREKVTVPLGELFAVKFESEETGVWSLNMHWNLRELNLERPCQKPFKACSWLLVLRRLCECSSLMLWFIMSFWFYSFDLVSVFIIVKFLSSPSVLPKVTPKILFCSPVS